MMTINDQIVAIIKKRQQRLPTIDLRIEGWRKLDSAVTSLEGALAPADGFSEKTTGAIEALNRLREHQIHNAITDRIHDWERVRNRCSRNTVNIGVSGQMKVGKSTLLQSISGLTDQAIPTSINQCTAVRSRIFHGASSEGTIKFHT